MVFGKRGKKKKESRGEEIGGIAFVGCLLAGLGVGQLYGRPDAGVLIGLGIGFIAMAIVRIRIK